MATAAVPQATANHTVGPDGSRYRHDGVRITHDPFAPGMAEKYGRPGRTDSEGFDPYSDSVGPGIYGGIVQRDADGGVVIGRQYQDHNPRPGPVYAGGGYAPSSEALSDPEGRLVPLLQKYPDLVNDVTTGGASPLHMCGMGARNQHAVGVLVERGADIEAADTYGMTPLHRMASNNLARGAEALLRAGADANNRAGCRQTPLQVACGSGARDVAALLEEYASRQAAPGLDSVAKLNVMGSGVDAVNGDYSPRDPSRATPRGFVAVCEQQGWDVGLTWRKLNGVDPLKDVWFAHESNDSYIYHNRSDGKWWVDGPDGSGVFIASGPAHAPPARGWQALPGVDAGRSSAPMVRTFRTLRR